MMELALLLAFALGWSLCWVTQASNRRMMDWAQERHDGYVRQMREDSQREASLAARIDSQADVEADVAEKLKEQVKAFEALDRTVGNVLTSLMASGVVRSVGPLREVQTGERPITRDPRLASLMEGDGGAVIPPAGADEML